MKSVAQSFCLGSIGLLLLGYLLGDWGFAHQGIPPLYVSEIVLVLCLPLFLIAPDVVGLLDLPSVWLLLALDVWCLFQTLPYVGIYGLDSFRDGVLYGYSIFAFIVAAYIIDARAIDRLCHLYGRIIPFCFIVMPFLLLTQPDDADLIPESAPFVFLKAGDVAVHLVGISSFMLLGLGSVVPAKRHRHFLVVLALFWLGVAVTAFWVVSFSRAAFLTLVVGMGLVSWVRFDRRQLIGLLGVGVVTIGVFVAADVHLELERRDISTSQIIENITSIVFRTEHESAVGQDLVSTAEWRLRWWEDIVEYCIFGEYFWAGKGFGINLADDDGYQTDIEGRLRSPHNGHLSFLARSGVPGLILWLSFLGAFALSLYRSGVRMRKRGLEFWYRFNLWIFSYWMAAVVDASFDVYLEGPQGGIWFWSITGLGLATLVLERRLLKGTVNPADAWAFRHEIAGSG